MKRPFSIVPALAAVVLIVGCERQPTPAEPPSPVLDNTNASAGDPKDYTFAQKAEFKAKMEAELDAINKELDMLAARIETASDAVKAEAKPRLDALRAESDRLKKQLDEVKAATEPTWENVKDTSKKAYADLKRGFNEVRQWLSEKIAP